MKKIASIITGIFSILLIFSACTNNSKDGYLLKMRLAKGDTFINNIKMDMDMAISMMGMDQKMKMMMDIGSHFQVLDSTNSGQQLKLTYTNMKMKMDLGMKMPGANTDSIMDATSKNAVGKSIIITVKDNIVTNVSGMDSLAFTNSTTESRAAVEKMFTRENMNQTFGMMFNMYPDKPVKVGDSWEKINEVELGMMKMKIKTTYTLSGVKDGLAELTMNGTIDSNGSMTQQGMDMKIDMGGTQKGRMTVKLATGYIYKGDYDMDITASMNAMGQKIPMTLKGKYTITGNQ